MRICMFAMVAGMCVVAFSFTGADVVVFTNDATIARDDYGYEGDDIIVSNGTLTIEGAHAFSTLSVYSNGFIEQYGEAELGAQGLFLDRGTFTLGGGCLLNVSNTVLLTNEARLIVQCTNLYISGDERWGGIGATIQASNLIVATGCVVTADAQGYPCVRPGWNGNGPGGGGGVTGGYIPGGGGYGGLGQIGHGAAAGQVYGTAHLPREPGSAGGGNYIPGGSANSGLSGGGAMRLNVWNTMSLDGVVSANGQGETYIYCGGGSGGSILANVNRLVGAGAFFAEGGNQEAHSGTDGGGGRVAVYFLDASNFTGFASSSVAGGPRAEAGTLFTSQTAVCFWDHALPLAHDEQTLAWAGMGMRADEVYVDITASNTGGVFTIASNRFVAGSLTWLTTHLPDAQYLLKATVYSLADAEIVSASTNVLVNNSVAWHSGVIDSNETWSSQRVHVVEGNVFVNTGVVVTVEAGAVVKFAPNTAMIIKTNALVVAHGSSGREITFTSLADDAA
ncbi:MAG: hypothetical protein EOM20_20540, partial [Spartobacteria bacterium]|nr:hypothetical protein [Spartobacteria bacterium]